MDTLEKKTWSVKTRSRATCLFQRNKTHTNQKHKSCQFIATKEGWQSLQRKKMECLTGLSCFAVSCPGILRWIKWYVWDILIAGKIKVTTRSVIIRNILYRSTLHFLHVMHHMWQPLGSNEEVLTGSSQDQQHSCLKSQVCEKRVTQALNLPLEAELDSYSHSEALFDHRHWSHQHFQIIMMDQMPQSVSDWLRNFHSVSG